MNKIKLYLFKPVGDLSVKYGEKYFVFETLCQSEIAFVFIWFDKWFQNNFTIKTDKYTSPEKIYIANFDDVEKDIFALR